MHLPVKPSAAMSAFHCSHFTPTWPVACPNRCMKDETFATCVLEPGRVNHVSSGSVKTSASTGFAVGENLAPLCPSQVQELPSHISAFVPMSTHGDLPSLATCECRSSTAPNLSGILANATSQEPFQSSKSLRYHLVSASLSSTPYHVSRCFQTDNIPTKLQLQACYAV